MSIETKLINIADNVNKVFNAGLSKGEKDAKSLYYISMKDFQWHKVEFPKNFNFVLKTAKTPYTCNAMLSGAVNVESVKLECEDKSGTAKMCQAFREMLSVKTIDLRSFNLKFDDISYFVYGSKELTTILGEIDLSLCTNVTSAFNNATSLKNIAFAPKTIKQSIDIHWSEELTHTSLLSILNGLYNYNVNIDLTNFRPDFATENEVISGIYKITDVYYDATDIFITTENDYHFRFLKSDCEDYLQEILENAKAGNYIEFSGNYDSGGIMRFDEVFLRSNPEYLEYTLTIGNKNLAKLSDEEKLIAENKGWTIK